MKKRILGLVCAVAVIVAMFAISISSATAAVVNIPSTGFSADDWTGDVDQINASGYFYDNKANNYTIWSKDSYDMSNGATFMSRIYFDNGQNNFYGEYAAMYLGAIDEGIEFRIKNTSGSDAYTGHLLIAGVEVATANLTKSPTTNAPNGGWEIVYDGSKVTVGSIPSVGGAKTLINWNLTAGGSNTEVSAAGLDLSNDNIGMRIAGNWGTNKRYWTVYAFSAEEAVSSSIPASSVPASSEPASSEPASSEPASSEPASSAPASSEPVSSTPDSSAAPAVGEKLTAAISGALKAEDWDPSEKIVDGKLSTGANASVTTVESVKTFDLGTEWEASMKFSTPTYMGNDAAQPTKLIIGEVEAIAYNSAGSSAAPYIALNVKGTEKGKHDLDASLSTTGGTGYSGTIVLTYKNGNITVTYKDEAVITYDATADALDFTAVKAGLSVKGNWSDVKNFKITEFGLTSADLEPEPGAPIDTVSEGVFNATDWTGDTDNLSPNGQFYATGLTKKTIWTKKAYDLSGGFKFSSRLYFKNSYNNYYGENAAIYVGSADTGLELRIQNKSGSGMYTGYLYYAGQEIANTDLLNAPNGGWEIVYKNGKVTVNHEDAPVTWTLPDTSTATSVAITGADFSRASIGVHIEGNYSSSDKRLWNTYSLSPASGSGSGGTNGTTGDARNLVVPAVALVLGACAAAFVLKSRKANA